MRIYYLFHLGFIERQPAFSSEDLSLLTQKDDEVTKSIKEFIKKLKAKELKGDFITLALKLKCPVLLNNEPELVRKLKAANIKVLDLDILMIYARTPVRLGDILKVKCFRTDEGFRGFLGDGSEVILHGRGLKSGRIVECEVTSVTETPKVRRIECDVI